MYTILHFNNGWYTGSFHTQLIAAIIDLASGQNLNSIRNGALADNAHFNIVGSTRVASDLNDFWTKIDASTVSKPCDTPAGQLKYASLYTPVSNQIYLRGGSRADFAAGFFSQNLVMHSTIAPANYTALKVHVSVGPRHIAVGLANDSSNVVNTVTLLSEITYEAMPYMNDSTGEFVPLVVSGPLCSALLHPINNSSTSNNPFNIPRVLTSTSSPESVSTAMNLDWRLGNMNSGTSPILQSIGNTQKMPDLSFAEAFLNMGVAASSASNGIIAGSISDKSGIFMHTGFGFPDPSGNSFSPNDILTIENQPYRILGKIAIPYK